MDSDIHLFRITVPRQSDQQSNIPQELRGHLSGSSNYLQRKNAILTGDKGNAREANQGFIFTWTFYEVPAVRWALTSGSIWRCGKRTVISSIYTLSQASS